MARLRRFLLRLVTFFRFNRAEDDLAREVESHLALMEDDFRRKGLTIDEARLAAKRAFGGVDQAKENHRDERSLVWLESTARDVRHATRALAKTPAFTVTAILTLAIGIGPSAAMVSLVRSLLGPLPIAAHPEDLIVLATTQAGNNRIFQRLAYPDYEDYRRADGTFQDLTAWDVEQVGLTADGRTDRLTVSRVSGNFFSLLGLEPAAGRLIDPRDDRDGSPPIVVLGHAYWTRQFSGDPSIVGRQVRIDGRSATVVGVAPRGFDGTFTLTRMDAYVPLAQRVPASRLADRSALSVRVLGRLKAGASLGNAQAFVDAFGAGLERAHPATNADRRTRVYAQRLAGMGPQNAGQLPLLTTFLLLLVGTVLLIASANIVGLFLARALQRRHEMAIHAALGASRVRLVRASMVEALLVATAGGALGGGAGLALVSWLAAQASMPGFPIYVRPSMDAWVFAYVAALMLACTLFIGLVPALRTLRTNPRVALSEGRGATASRATQRLRTMLVAAQITGAVALLLVGGLFVRTVKNLGSVSLGFDRNRVLLAAVDPSAVGYDEVRTRAFYRAADAGLLALPGVERVAESAFAPFGSGNSTSYVATEDSPPPTSQTGVLADRHFVSGEYFKTIGTPLLRGRVFTVEDDRDRQPFAVINEAMAARLWPGQDAIGKRFRETDGSDKLVEVAGVVADARYERDELRGSAHPRYFLSLNQFFQPARIFHVRVADGRPRNVATSLERVLRRMDASVPINDVVTLDEHIDFGGNGFGGARAMAFLAGIVGLLAFALAMVGIYGVLSFAVTTRTSELGVRMALGARRGHVLRMVLLQMVRITLVGIVCGVALSLASGRVIGTVMTGVPVYDLTATFTVIVIVASVTTLVCYLPARRATNVDPLIALRCE